MIMSMTTHESMVYTELVILCVFPYPAPFDFFPTRGLNCYIHKITGRTSTPKEAGCICYREDNFKMEKTKNPLPPGRGQRTDKIAVVQH